MHNIEHYDYPEKVNKKTVQSELNDYVSYETRGEGGGGIDPIRWNDVVCKSYDDAIKWIESHDKGWYDCLAVKYEEPIKSLTKSAKEAELEQKELEARKLYGDRSNALYPRTRTSEFIGCSKCGSRLANKYLNSNFCPVCRADLRPETTLNSIRAAKDKWERAKNALKDYQMNHGRKEVRWLVKIEYHT